MPQYEYECDRCGQCFTATLPMQQCHEPQPCPACKAPTHKNAVTSGVNGQVFRAYESVTYGIPPHAAALAERDTKGNLWHRDPDTGRKIMLNMPGEQINEKGNIVIRTSGERRRMMQLRNAVELNDYSSLSAEHKRRQEAAKAKLAKSAERNRRGREAARRAGSKLGWVRE